MTAAKIICLPVERWQEYKLLRLKALQSDPQAFGQSYAEASSHPDEKWQQRLREANAGSSFLFFAESAGRLVGCVGAFQDEEDKERSCAYIYGMFVDLEARSNGIGSSLLSRLLAELGSRGIRKARLDVNISQQSAKSLYERFGFAGAGSEYHVMGDGEEHLELAMELSIRPVRFKEDSSKRSS